jgi:hypothetical protein
MSSKSSSSSSSGSSISSSSSDSSDSEDGKAVPVAPPPVLDEKTLAIIMNLVGEQRDKKKKKKSKKKASSSSTGDRSANAKSQDKVKKLEAKLQAALKRNGELEDELSRYKEVYGEFVRTNAGDNPTPLVIEVPSDATFKVEYANLFRECIKSTWCHFSAFTEKGTSPPPFKELCNNGVTYLTTELKLQSKEGSKEGILKYIITKVLPDLRDGVALGEKLLRSSVTGQVLQVLDLRVFSSTHDRALNQNGKKITIVMFLMMLCKMLYTKMGLLGLKTGGKREKSEKNEKEGVPAEAAAKREAKSPIDSNEDVSDSDEEVSEKSKKKDKKREKKKDREKKSKTGVPNELVRKKTARFKLSSHAVALQFFEKGDWVHAVCYVDKNNDSDMTEDLTILKVGESGDPYLYEGVITEMITGDEKYFTVKYDIDKTFGNVLYTDLFPDFSWWPQYYSLAKLKKKLKMLGVTPSLVESLSYVQTVEMVLAVLKGDSTAASLNAPAATPFASTPVTAPGNNDAPAATPSASTPVTAPGNNDAPAATPSASTPVTAPGNNDKKRKRSKIIPHVVLDSDEEREAPGNNDKKRQWSKKTPIAILDSDEEREAGVTPVAKKFKHDKELRLVTDFDTYLKHVEAASVQTWHKNPIFNLDNQVNLFDPKLSIWWKTSRLQFWMSDLARIRAGQQLNLEVYAFPLFDSFIYTQVYFFFISSSKNSSII